jgi:hypothetical protein
MNYYDPAESLFRVGRHLLEIVLKGYLNGPIYDPTYEQVAWQMVYAEDNPRWRNIMHGVFHRREIFGSSP